jgi:hypothetical protein
MMVVVPPLAKGYKRQEPVVSGLIPGKESPSANPVGKGIDGKGRMVKNNRTQNKTHNQTRPSADDVSSDPQKDSGQITVAIEPPELGILEEILYPGIIVMVAEVPAVKDPPHMGIEKPVNPGGMRILGSIRIAMMMAMNRRPVDHPLLGGCLTEESEDKLKEARGLKGAMGKVPVISRGDGKHPDPKKKDPQKNIP